MELLEDNLRKAMARQEPAGDFTARVMARVARESRPVSGGFRRVSLATLAIAFLIASGGVYGEGRIAKRKLMLAMRIAGTKMQEVRLRVVANTENQP